MISDFPFIKAVLLLVSAGERRFEPQVFQTLDFCVGKVICHTVKITIPFLHLVSKTVSNIVTTRTKSCCSTHQKLLHVLDVLVRSRSYFCRMKRTREENNKAFMVALGQNIDKIRWEKRITKIALAKACGFTATKTSKICLGRNEVRASDIARIAKVLGVSCGRIFDFKYDEYL